jgi:hypothetical protein
MTHARTHARVCVCVCVCVCMHWYTGVSRLRQRRARCGTTGVEQQRWCEHLEGTPRRAPASLIAGHAGVCVCVRACVCACVCVCVFVTVACTLACTNPQKHKPRTDTHTHTRTHAHTQVVYICIKTMSVRCVHIAKKTFLFFLLHKLHDHIYPPLPTSFLYIYDILSI